jgi:hypothetical protein
MAIHSTIAELVQSAMKEYLDIAHYCIMTGKPTGGCFGFPAATLLLIIVDTIGSYYRGNTVFKIPIDGKDKTIDGNGNKHYRILNSQKYYNQRLSNDDIKRIYEYYRCLMTHNAAIPFGQWLEIGDPDDEVFVRNNQNQINRLRLVPFYSLSVYAVSEFLKECPGIINNSKQMNCISMKK